MTTHKRKKKTLSLFLLSLSCPLFPSLPFSRALLFPYPAIALAMPPTNSRLPLPVRPDVYPLLGALALATAGALSFSFFTLRKTFKERSVLQEEGKRAGER